MIAGTLQEMAVGVPILAAKGALKDYAVPEPPDREELAAYSESLVVPPTSTAPPVANEPAATG